MALPLPYLPTSPARSPYAFFAVPQLVHGDDGVWAEGSSALSRAPRSSVKSIRTTVQRSHTTTILLLCLCVQLLTREASRSNSVSASVHGGGGRGMKHGMGLARPWLASDRLSRLIVLVRGLGDLGREAGGRTNPGIHGDSGRWMEGWTCYAIGR
jgi:hypothetical protein